MQVFLTLLDFFLPFVLFSFQFIIRSAQFASGSLSFDIWLNKIAKGT